jgi:hypothetical protein
MVRRLQFRPMVEVSSLVSVLWSIEIVNDLFWAVIDWVLLEKMLIKKFFLLDSNLDILCSLALRASFQKKFYTDQKLLS